MNSRYDLYITPEFFIAGHDEFVRLDEIENIQIDLREDGFKFKNYDFIVKPILAMTGNKYFLINYNNKSIKHLVRTYNKKSSIKCFVITDTYDDKLLSWMLEFSLYDQISTSIRDLVISVGSDDEIRAMLFAYFNVQSIKDNNKLGSITKILKGLLGYNCVCGETIREYLKDKSESTVEYEDSHLDISNDLTTDSLDVILDGLNAAVENYEHKDIALKEVAEACDAQEGGDRIESASLVTDLVMDIWDSHATINHHPKYADIKKYFPDHYFNRFKEQIITLQNDNVGFSTFSESVTDEYEKIMNKGSTNYV